MKTGNLQDARGHLMILLVAAIGFSACASTSAPTSSGVTPANPHTIVNMPGLKESLEGNCHGGAIKECRVWGGNKFRKRYEYCGCRERRGN